MESVNKKLEAFGRLLEIMDTLRVQCPWDRKQTFDSLRANTIEEVFELSDAVENKDFQAIKEEVGDVLLHIVFYSKMGDEEGKFDIADVCNAISDKMVFRHPHIYGEVKANTAEDVLNNWEKIKQKEKNGEKTVLGGVPRSLPSMIKAYRIQDKARHVGFDWEKREEVWAKVKEEIAELEAEMAKGNTESIENEFGDVFFSLVNAARLYDVNPDNALEHTNRKFISRFNYVEQKAKEMGKRLEDMTLGEMDALWNEAKQLIIDN